MVDRLWSLLVERIGVEQPDTDTATIEEGWQSEIFASLKSSELAVDVLFPTISQFFFLRSLEERPLRLRHWGALTTIATCGEVLKEFIISDNTVMELSAFVERYNAGISQLNHWATKLWTACSTT